MASWHGATCHEQVRHEFAAGADDEAAARQWNGDFRHEPGSIGWSYQVSGDTLREEGSLLSSGRVRRHLIAVRQAP